MKKIKIKKGDSVEVIAGDNKGHKGKILKILPQANKVVVEGAKLVKKTVKKGDKYPEGGFIQKEMPMDISNIKKAVDNNE